MTAGYKWRPLVRASGGEFPREVIQATCDEFGISPTEARTMLIEEDKRFKAEYWINDLYQVLVNHIGDNMVQLNIRRRDGAPIIRDWRHFQLIKNQLVGPECEGIELYPAESRKQDMCNKYHIWCCTDPTFRFPIGFSERRVITEEVKSPPGLRQRADK